jgi:hypothetical protein
MRRVIVYSIFIILIALLLSSNAVAAQLSSPGAPFLPEATNVLLNAATATPTTGSVVSLGKSATLHKCDFVLGGTAPVSVTVSFMVGNNATTPTTVATHTYTVATPTTKSFEAEYAGQYIQASYDSKVGGDATTSVTLICTSVQGR